MTPADRFGGPAVHLPTLELFSPAGRVAIGTGGHRNLGLGLSRGLAGAGAHVLIANPNADSGEAAAAARRGMERRRVCNRRERSGGLRADGRVCGRSMGRIDILVNTP